MEGVEKEKLSDRATVDIMEMITIQHRFGPGDKLPNENELSEELGVSRTTLREAVNNLVSQNVLEKKRGKGTYVVDNNQLTDDLGFDNLNYMHIRLSDLYELRLMIEPQIAGIAATKATEQELADLYEYGRKIEEKDTPRDQVIEYNRRFHNAIAKATHNEFIIRLFHNINTAIVKEFNMEDSELMTNRDMIESHKMIMEYLRLRDSEGATQAMRLHLKYSVQDFKLDVL
ncbi:MAG: FadR/GntR family transcriptional regulator [Lachnospiraceae bacterium]|nr:FadR/GntR family transcriptional regulator [Lachnospiraceae bacterium]